MKKQFRKVPINCAIAGVDDSVWKKVADNFVTVALEHDTDSHTYEINSPEHAAVSGLNSFRDMFNEADEYGELADFLSNLKLPADLKLTKALAKQLKPIFLESASKYNFDEEYDDSFSDWG